MKEKASLLLALILCILAAGCRMQSQEDAITKPPSQEPWLAQHATSSTAVPEDLKVKRDSDSVVTVAGLTLAMSYETVVKSWGQPCTAWLAANDGHDRLLSDSELRELRKKGRKMFPALTVVRFERTDELKKGEEVEIGIGRDDGKVTYVIGDSLELDGQEIGTQFNGASQLKNLTDSLGKPSIVKKTLLGEEFQYRDLRLTVELATNLDRLRFVLGP